MASLCAHYPILLTAADTRNRGLKPLDQPGTHVRVGSLRMTGNLYQVEVFFLRLEDLPSSEAVNQPSVQADWSVSV